MHNCSRILPRGEPWSPSTRISALSTPLRSTASSWRNYSPYVTLLKLSDEEVEFLGDDLISQVPIVVVTRCGEGFSVQAGETKLNVPAAQVPVTDTMGAGDTIMAALLTQIDERGLDSSALAQLGAAEWKELLSFAAAAAGITVSRKGANPPRREEVESSI